jgi:hypothetical protein
MFLHAAPTVNADRIYRTQFRNLYHKEVDKDPRARRALVVRAFLCEIRVLTFVY